MKKCESAEDKSGYVKVCCMCVYMFLCAFVCSGCVCVCTHSTAVMYLTDPEKLS